MSDRTADQTADTHEPRWLFDLVFPLAFGAVAALATIVWLGAIGWIAWQPVRSWSPALLISMVDSICESQVHPITSFWGYTRSFSVGLADALTRTSLVGLSAEVARGGTDKSPDR